MNVKKILTWAVGLFVVWLIVTQPTAAASAATNILNGLKGAASSAATFLTSVGG